jgi:hypothetical protein
VTAVRRHLLLAVTMGLAPGPARPRHPPAVRTIIGRFVAARGGLARLRAVRTVRMVGTITFGAGPAFQDVVELERPDRVRTRLALADGVLIQAYDGCTAWMIDGSRGDTLAHVLAPGVAKNVAAGADIDGPLVDAAAKGNRVTFAGLDTTGGRSAWALQVDRPDSTVDIYEIDTVSYRQVRWLGHRTMNGHPVVFESTFGDYRRVAGVLFPFRIASRTRGRSGGQRVVFDSVAVNVPIPARDFAMPGARVRAGCAATR